VSEARTCPQCGAILQSDAPEGLCPDCLGKLALGETVAQASSPAGSGGVLAASANAGPGGPSNSQPGTVALQRFGDYELIEEIAHGGMGVVYKARQMSLNRTVAVKMIRAGQFASKEFVHRFRVEASAAAVLQHPNIVAVHEVGVHEGQHFFSMDYVAEKNLAQIVRDGPLPPNRAARYVQKIAAAIHYAHQSGILHRDLKPSNVIIDANDQPRITDFGLAKQLNVESSATLTGEIMGTPGYMPPEQASGNRGAVKAWSDVYSIGAILYHLLTGRAPFAAGSLEETLNQVLHQDPISVRLLNPAVPRDLNTICLKCLEKEPAKRYASALLLADELTRFLNHEPILARPISTVGKAARWCRRKPALAGTGGVALLAMILGFAGVLWQWQNSESHRKNAEATVTRLEIDRAEMLFESGQSAEALAYLARVVRREPTNRVAGERIISALAHRNFCVPLFRLEHKGAVTSAEFSPDGGRVLTASKDGTTRVCDARTGQPLLAPFQHAAEVTAAHFSPDGLRLVTTSLDKTARIWDAQTGQPIAETLRHESAVLCADFSPDGKRLATGSGDGLMRLWDAATGARLDMSVKLNGGVEFVKFSPDGKWIALASPSGSGGDGRVVNATDGTELNTFLAYNRSGSGTTFSFPSFSADGTRVVTARPTDGGTRFGLDLMWNTSSRSNRLVGITRALRITSARFSPDGQYVATSAWDNTARIWDADTIQAVGEAMRHEEWVNCVEFSPDGRQVVSGSKDHTARIWDARTGQPLSEPLPHDASVLSAQFSPDGRRILSLCDGPMVWVWEVRGGHPLPALLQHPAEVYKAVFNPDGERVATTTRTPIIGGNQIVRVWDARRAVPLMSRLGLGSWDIEFSADGRRLLAVDKTSVAQAIATVWDSQSGRIVGGPFVHTNTLRRGQFSPDGQLVLGAGTGSYRVWDIATGNLVHEFPNQLVDGFAQFSPDGKWVLATREDNSVRLLDLRSGQPVTEPLRHDGEVVWGDISADSQRVATISRDQTARIWDAGSGRLLHTLRHTAEPYQYNSVKFNPDGRLLVTSAGNAAQVWDSHTGQAVTAPLKHDGRVNSVRFSPDGKRVVTACFDGTARIWDAASGHSLSEPLKHRERVSYAEFSRDGHWVVTASGDGTAKIWEVPTLSASVPSWLPEWAEVVAGQRLDARNASQSLPFEEVHRFKELVARMAEGDETGRWAKWFFAEYSTRTISPASLVTLPQMAEQRVQENTLESLQHAIRLSPTNAPAQARLAFVALTNETTPGASLLASSDWQSRRVVALAPSDPDVWWTRAQVCERLGRAAEAWEAMQRAVSLNSTNAAFWNAWGLTLEKSNRVDEAFQAYARAVQLAGPWQGRTTLPALAWRNRSNLLKRLGRLAEAASANLQSLHLAERHADTPPHEIDLSSYYNRGSDLGGGALDDFSLVLTGRVTLDLTGTPIEFYLRGVIQLKSGNAGWDVDVPESVRGIAIRQKCRRLHFLHVGRVSGAPRDGVTVGAYRMRYGDGEEVALPIVYGHHLRSLSPPFDPKDPLDQGTKVGWAGTTPESKEPLRLFLTTWENPRPDVAIESLDFVSSANRVVPFLFAITAEP